MNRLSLIIILAIISLLSSADQSRDHLLSADVNEANNGRPVHEMSNKDNEQNGNQSAHKSGFGSSDPNAIVLSSHPFCRSDINKICGKSDVQLDNNLAVLSCVQNDDTRLHLSKECNHLIWSFKRNLTNDNHFSGIAKTLCQRLIDASPECVDTQSERVLSPSANLLSCLIDKISAEDSDGECKSFLTKMELIIFSDYRLIHKFTDYCEADIEKLRCGRLEMSSEAEHSQGETIDCLEKSADKLSSDCKHQILRIAELQSDDFHLDRALYFACREDREHFCRRIQSGEGKVYRCLMRHKLEHDMSLKCREKLFQREMLTVRDYKVAHGLAKACRQDIRTHHCRENTSDQKEVRLAQILLCLENAVNSGFDIEDECRAEMLTHRRTLMENFSLTPALVADCELDIDQYCNRLEVGGKTLHCLIKHSKPRRRGAKKGQISDRCRRSLEDLLKETNVGEDWRVDPVLQKSCQTHVDHLCSNVEPGEGRVMSCLMDNLDSHHMSGDCRQALLQIQYFVVRDFQLDASLYKSCHSDAIKHCHARSDWSQKPDHIDLERGPTVLSCLYRYAYHPNRNIRLSSQCVYDIRRVMKQRAQSVDLMPDIEEPCLHDLASYCSGQQEGQKEEDVMRRGYEMECLQANYQTLEAKCRAAIGNFTEEESEHLELNYPLIKACAVAIKEVCSDLLDREVDEGDLMQCLVDNKNKPGIKRHPKCRVAVEHFQLLSLKDFRFSFKFKESCKADVLTHCRTVRTKFDVVSCLSGIVFNDTVANRHKQRVSPDCKNQLRVELLERNEDIRFDPSLDTACAEDKKNFCADISPGESQILECLKSNMHLLKKSCQRHLFKHQKIEMSDNSIDYLLMTNCKSAIARFCANVEAKEVLFCLRVNRDNFAMDKRCRSLVVKRLAQQNTDYRLNPRLKKACERDVPKFCGQIVDKQESDDQFEGKVIACLKRQYVFNKLSQSCEIEIVNVIREVAQNVELDPILYKSCQNEIKAKCSQEADVEECLKTRFQNKEIGDESCRTQIAHLINEVKADIQSDPLLHKVCVHDIKRLCADIPSGHGRQLSCLLAVVDSDASKLSAECKTILVKRVEMFEYAAQLAPADSVAQVYKLVATSPAKNYFMFVSLSFVVFIFAGGLLCGRVTKRIQTNDKIK